MDLKSVFKSRYSGEPRCAIEELGRGDVGDPAIALYSVLVIDDPNEALLISVTHGGDSDSTAFSCVATSGGAGGGVPVEGYGREEQDRRRLSGHVALDETHEEPFSHHMVIFTCQLHRGFPWTTFKLRRRPIRQGYRD